MSKLVELLAAKQAKLAEAVKVTKEVKDIDVLHVPFTGYFAQIKTAYNSINSISHFDDLFFFENQYASLANVPAFKQKLGAIGFKLYSEIDSKSFEDLSCVAINKAIEKVDEHINFLCEIKEDDDKVIEEDIEQLKFVRVSLLDVLLAHKRYLHATERQRIMALSEEDLMNELGYSQQERYDYYHLADFNKNDLVQELLELEHLA